MKLFKVYVDGQIFYHPNLSKLAITQAVVSEDARKYRQLYIVCSIQSSIHRFH